MCISISFRCIVKCWKLVCEGEERGNSVEKLQSYSIQPHFRCKHLNLAWPGLDWIGFATATAAAEK